MSVKTSEKISAENIRKGVIRGCSGRICPVGKQQGVISGSLCGITSLFTCIADTDCATQTHGHSDSDAATLTFDLLTFNFYTILGVMRSNSVQNLSKIEYTPAELSTI